MLVKLNTSALHKVSNDPMTHEARYYLSLAMGVRNAYKVPSWVPPSSLLAGMIFDAPSADSLKLYLHKSSPLFKRYGIPWTDKKLSCHLFEGELEPVEEWDTYTEINLKLLTL